MDYTVRPYRHTDETAWVRCRLLAFLKTSYFDDVKQRKTSIAEPGFELVAVDPAGELVGLIDVEVEQGEATVDTIAVHPDHVARGIGRALLNDLGRVDTRRSGNIALVSVERVHRKRPLPTRLRRRLHG